MAQSQAIVTGGARGIGNAIARMLAAQGWSVTMFDRDAAEVAAAAAQAASEGFDMAGRAVDITDRAAVAEAIADIDKLDLIVNNAGIAAELLPFAQLGRADFDRMLRVNVHGSFVVAQEAARRMAGGAIVNIASRGYLGGAGAAHYVASKTAVVAMTRAMAVELRWRKIAVNAVAPGMVETRMIADFTDAMRAQLTALEPSGAALAPRSIASAVAYLASEDGRKLNGQVILVDGGKSLGVEPL
jgi:3-oxoacyl-[acyl-carrier protein] reductase